MLIPFRKMNGLGNDFVVIDARRDPVELSPERVRAIADRSTGVGLDQLITLETPRSRDADVLMGIRNADGGAVEACGNAARCVAALILEETGKATVTIETRGGVIVGRAAEPGAITIDMGVPRFDAPSIPLAKGAGDPLHLRFDEPGLAVLGPAACVNVGNPHAVFYLRDADGVPLEALGPRLERHALFPERANISFVTIEAPDSVRARVWERGVGATRACGTAACAIAAVGARLGRTADVLTVSLPGGPLRIALNGGRIEMTGPYALDWSGVLTATGYRRDDDVFAQALAHVEH